MHIKSLVIVRPLEYKPIGLEKKNRPKYFVIVNSVSDSMLEREREREREREKDGKKNGNT